MLKPNRALPVGLEGPHCTQQCEPTDPTVFAEPAKKNRKKKKIVAAATAISDASTLTTIILWPQSVYLPKHQRNHSAFSVLFF